jgi:hypothetical protein
MAQPRDTYVALALEEVQKAQALLDWHADQTVNLFVLPWKTAQAQTHATLATVYALLAQLPG